MLTCYSFPFIDFDLTVSN